MKKITKKQAEVLCYKADSEGLDYAIQEGYLDAPGTELEAPVKAAKAALQKVNAILEGLKEQYELEDC